MREYLPKQDQTLSRYCFEELLRLRDGMSTVEDWKYLMKRTSAEVVDITAFN